jgi:DNA (cytosine-5)-methyltransferase 1
LTIYYNENDPFCVEWLKNLIAAKLIPTGDVDARSILDVTPNDLKPYRQCHFFAGIGGWACALALADFPADREVWTGSCPCQPFSAAGKGGGFADERHLWPAWFHLIANKRPATVLGEQVASKAGCIWLDLVHDDLEAKDYAFGVSDLGAACIGAPHIRQRLWFVADRALDGRREECEDGERFVARNRAQGIAAGFESGGCVSPWSELEWLPCTDGKARSVEPGTFPLAHGISDRVGRLRAYGNAIIPQVAAEFVKAFLEL